MPGGWGSFLTPDLWRLFAHQLLDSGAMLPRVIATGWLVLEVTDSPFWVGAVFGIEGLVLLSCGGLGGVLAARVERRRTLAAVQGALALVLIAIAALSALEVLRLWHLVAAAVLTGLARCLHLPLSTGLLQRAAGQGQLMRAMGAKQLTFNIGRMAGSALVGVTISALGFAAAFLLLAVIRAGAAAVLARLSPELGRPAPVTRSRPVFLDLVRQLRYTLRVPRVRAVFAMSMLMELCVFSVSSMMPVLARDVLGVGAGALGGLTAAGSFGAILFGMVMTAAGELRSKGSVAMLACLLCGVALIGYALSRWFLVSVGIAVVLGVAMMVYDVMLFTLVQVTVPSSRRDQSTGLLAQTFGLNPVGSTLAGAVAQVAGMPAALLAAGGIIVAYALAVLAPKRRLWDRPDVRKPG
ncbi:MAG: MFS transporter [Spirochaetaceae bacterium]|nr:MFS transporter [Spirochaetaceae bacterium]